MGPGSRVPEALQSHMAWSWSVGLFRFLFLFLFSIFSAQTVLSNTVKSEVTMKDGGTLVLSNMETPHL